MNAVDTNFSLLDKSPSISTTNLSSHFPQSGTLAGVRKSRGTYVKIYYYLNEEQKEIEVARYSMKTPYMRKQKEKALALSGSKGIYTPMGEGLHAKIVTRYNPNSELVKKEFTAEYGDPLNPYRLHALIYLQINKKFQDRKLFESICLPFQLPNKPKFIYMKKVPGVSLEEMSEKGENIVEVTKKQVMDLYKAIIALADEDEFRIVHKDIHAGNILSTWDGRLVLIDFDECISIEDKRAKRMAKNKDFIEFPTDDDYLNGYDDTTPGFIEDYPNPQEEDFYQTSGIYQQYREESLQKYREIFQKDDRSLFDDEEFKSVGDKDIRSFQVKIKIRVFENDF